MTMLAPILSLAALAAAAPQQPAVPAVETVSVQDRQAALEHFRAGLDKMREESWEEAEQQFRLAVRLDPLLAGAYYGLGQSRMALKRYPEAVQAFVGCRDTHLRLASLQVTDQALADQRRDDEIRELRESIRLFQSGTAKSAGPQNMILRLEARLAQLETERRRGSQSAEVPAEVSLALGSAYFRNGQLPEAEQGYRDAVEVNAKMGEAHNNLAVVLMLTGRLDEAEKEVKAAEKAGFPVNPRFKDDLKKARAAAPPR